MVFASRFSCSTRSIGGVTDQTLFLSALEAAQPARWIHLHALVKIPIKKLASEDMVQGTTIAELGNRNRPLDMIVYNQHGKAFALVVPGVS